MSSELFEIIRSGEPDKLRALLQGSTDCNSCDDEGMTALMLAANLGRLEMVEALIASGADVNAADALGWTALMKAIYNYEMDRGFPEIVSALIAAGAEFENQIAYGTRPLMLAAGYGQAGVIEVLLAAGVDVLATNEGGFTARRMAEYKDYVEVINQLYEAEIALGAQGGCSTQQAPGVSVVNFVRNPEH